jgi:hypothetical protein
MAIAPSTNSSPTSIARSPHRSRKGNEYMARFIYGPGWHAAGPLSDPRNYSKMLSAVKSLTIRNFTSSILIAFGSDAKSRQSTTHCEVFQLMPRNLIDKVIANVGCKLSHRGAPHQASGLEASTMTR